MTDPTKVTQDNIQAIYDHEQQEIASQSTAVKIVSRIAGLASTVTFAVIHVVFFAAWILLNTLSPVKFDPFPFIFLTLVVSLESTFLSIFMLISQNSSSGQSERRHDLDLQINLLAEKESTAILRLLSQIAEKHGISEDDRQEAILLSDDTNPAEILEQIVTLEKETK